jgi:CubicO group peptidase (beta-lactamase class C family)
VTRKRKRGFIILGAILGVATACALALTATWWRDVPRVATGFIAHTLCSATFVSGLDPDQVFSDTTEAMLAVYRKGLGCLVENGHGPVDASPPAPETGPAPLLPEIAGPSLVDAANPDLSRALDRAFAEREQPPFRHTKAVVVVRDGHVIAERYAAGYGIDTPILGFSATKSVTSALIGILVRKGQLAVNEPAPIAAWQSPDDPHHAITIDQLLRHTSGLKMGSSLNASLASVLDTVNQMKYIERDMAGFAERASLEAVPGTAWNYHDGNYLILSRIIRDAVGGHAADVMQFARRELFDPLSMHHVTLEFDATGTPEGSSQMLASARDWARFGLLYLNDGVVGGSRILPDGWVHASASLTPGAWAGMGAGFWTNLDDSKGSRFRTGLGMPHDAFYASGVLGQYVIIVPSQRLVIARFGVSGNQYDIEGFSKLVADVIAALGSQATTNSH